FPLTARTRQLASIALLGFVVGIVGLAFFEAHGLSFTLLLTTYFAATGSPLLDLGTKDRRADTLAVLKKLLASTGYSLTEAPRTGDPEVDPLIASVDLLALAGSQGYAIKIQVLESQRTSADWSLAADVRAGAMALQGALRNESTTGIIVQPYV